MTDRPQIPQCEPRDIRNDCRDRAVLSSISPVDDQRLATPPRTHRVPLWLKGGFTAFMLVMVPYYYKAYGPANFLYFCDVAMFVILVALWTENRFLVSLQAVAILLPQTIWVLDYGIHAIGLLLGRDWQLTGMTAYMFTSAIPPFVRALSSFHGWLPFLLVYLLTKLGYDRRAFPVQVVLGITLLLVCYLFMPAPPAPPEHPAAAVNINYVYGLHDEKPQTWMDPRLWLAILIVGIPVLFYLPTHLILRAVFDRTSRLRSNVTDCY